MSETPSQPAALPSRLKGFRVVSGLTLLSRIAGLGRDILMAALFGTGWVLDAFTVAFRIPGLFRKLFGEGAMTAAFLPRFVEEDQTRGRSFASALFAETARRLTLWLTTIVVIAEVGMLAIRVLMELPDRTALLVELSMITLPYAVLICVVALYCAALNGVHHFLVPAALPVVLNVVWFAGGLLGMVLFVDRPDCARAIAARVLVGGIVQVAMGARMAAHYDIRWTSHLASGEMRVEVARLFRQMVPVLFGLSIMQLNGMIDSLVAWFLAQPLDQLPVALQSLQLPEGTASALYLGQRLFQFPLGIFGVALGTVLFPRFARHAAANDRDELGRDIRHGLQLVLVAVIPASAGLWLLSEPITDLLFRHGAFDARDSELTARMIAGYGAGVWVYCGLLIVNRVFYAANDQMTPVRHGLVCVGVNIILNVVLLPLLKEMALPIASVLATLVQLLLALEVLRRRFLPAGYAAFVPVLWRALLGTAVMSVCCVLLLRFIPTGDSLIARLPPTVIPVAACAGAYWCCLHVMGLSPGTLLQEPYRDVETNRE